MDITKHGDVNTPCSPAEEFKCAGCGCEFLASEDEYYVEEGSFITCSSTSSTSNIYTYSSFVTDKYICSCPECHKIVVKEKRRERSCDMPFTTTLGSDLYTSTTYIPDACKNCANHPSNGGSGICNCTLGLPKITC